MEPWTLKELLQLFMISQYLAVTKVLPVALEVIVLFAALPVYAESRVNSSYNCQLEQMVGNSAEHGRAHKGWLQSGTPFPQRNVPSSF